MGAGFRRIELTGEKVRLRPAQPSDSRAAYSLVKSGAVLSTLAWNGPENEHEMHNTYKRWHREVKSGDSCNLTIETADTSEVIGCLGIRFPRHPQQADIGYWLGESNWNGGLMTDAVRLACHLVFHHLDAVRANATVFVGNLGSRRVLEKNGFSLDGTLRCHFYKSGRWLDGWYFTLLRGEWQDRREYYIPRHEDISLNWLG